MQTPAVQPLKLIQEGKKFSLDDSKSNHNSLITAFNELSTQVSNLVEWQKADIRKAPQIPLDQATSNISLDQPSSINTLLFERKAAYGASAYCITTNLPSILPIAIQEIISFQSQPAQVATGILFYALINTCMEKLLTQGSLERVMKLGKQGLSLLQNTLTSILQTLLSASAKLASIGYSLVKWLIKILTPSVLLSTAVHLAKPEMKLPEMIFNSTQEAISTYQLDTLATVVMENPYTPYGIAFFLVLLSLGTLKNGYDYYSTRNKNEVIIITE